VYCSRVEASAVNASCIPIVQRTFNVISGCPALARFALNHDAYSGRLRQFFIDSFDRNK
jgi:hypothetical protein